MLHKDTKKRFLMAFLLFVLASVLILGSYSVIKKISEIVDTHFSVTDNSIRYLFTEITGEQFPHSAIIVEKEGSHGFLDSYMTAIIRLDTTDYNKIHAILSTDSLYATIEDTIWTTHVERIRLLQKVNVSDIGFKKYKSGYKVIGFGSNKRHIIIKHED